MVTASIQVDKTFHALADPTRRLILDRLSEGPMSVSELAAPLPMSLAAVGQHIKLLDECGVIRTQKVGRVRTCYVQPEALQVVEQWIARHRMQWERSLDRLGELLAEVAEP